MKSLLLLDSVNADFLAVLADALELYGAVDKSEKSVIGTTANVVARVDVGTALLNEDVTSEYELTVCTFYAKSLGLRVTTVVGGTLTFFMRKELNVNIEHVLHLSESNVVRVLPGKGL